ncbi:unnamed protein product, partial [Amoebophrya sp. A120]|eukprot:GSA120T00007657001.1
MQMSIRVMGGQLICYPTAASRHNCANGTPCCIYLQKKPDLRFWSHCNYNHRFCMESQS